MGKRLICYVDGGAKPNPGDCYGSFMVFNGKSDPLANCTFKFGYGTNNQAEYTALIQLLQYLVANNLQHVDINMDSSLVVNQVTGKWSTKNKKLLELKNTATTLLSALNDVKFKHISGNIMKKILGH